MHLKNYDTQIFQITSKDQGLDVVFAPEPTNLAEIDFQVNEFLTVLTHHTL